MVEKMNGSRVVRMILRLWFHRRYLQFKNIEKQRAHCKAMHRFASFVIFLSPFVWLLLLLLLFLLLCYRNSAIVFKWKSVCISFSQIYIFGATISSTTYFYICMQVELQSVEWDREKERKYTKMRRRWNTNLNTKWHYSVWNHWRL